MKQFSFYEFSGILLPGTVILYGLIIAFPDMKESILGLDVTVGDLGIFVLLAYICGHIVQAIGNFLENIWWMRNGMPTDWIRTNKKELISSQQRQILMDKVRNQLVKSPSFDIEKINKKEWYSIVRQVYAVIEVAERSKRADIFNGNYGLNRGLSAAFFALTLLSLFLNLAYWKASLLLFVVGLICIYRMNRFAKHYARELFVQYLSID